MSTPAGRSSTEWPKLDLAKQHVTRLALAWTVSYDADAAALFAALLDDEGSFAGVLSYTKRRVRHYRVEAAQLSAEDNALLVTVQYQADTGSLLQIPRNMQDRAWLLAPMQTLAPTAPVLCHADLAFESSPRLSTNPALPIRPPVEDRNTSYDEIYGVRGVRHSIAGDPSHGYTFGLDRLPTGDVVLALDFVLAPDSPAETPVRALDLVRHITRFLVKEEDA
jgi:hypothetical protein